MRLVSSALWKLKLGSCSQLPLKQTNLCVYQSPHWEISPSAPSSSTTTPLNSRQLEISPTTCPLITIIQVSFSTHCALHDTGQNPKQSAEVTQISQFAWLSEEMKAELLAGNTTCSSHFPPQEESKGNSCEHCSPMLWEWEQSPFQHRAKETAEETTTTFHHQTPNFQLFKTWAFSWSAQKPGCRVVLRHRFNFCPSDLRNTVPVCQKKVNERFSHPHNHVSVTFGSCKLMPEIFGGYPLWSSLIHNQCPINLQEPNYNDYWPFPMHTKTQWVTVMLLASGYSQIRMHICTPSKYPMLIAGCLLPFEEFFMFAWPRAELRHQDLWTFCCKKFGADSRCSFANREILLLHLLRLLFT